MNKTEYGCECISNCGVHPELKDSKTAPICFIVERNGENVKVCSRCTLFPETIVKQCYDENTDMTPFHNYDDEFNIYGKPSNFS